MDIFNCFELAKTKDVGKLSIILREIGDSKMKRQILGG
jgi:hypothetical protein